MSMSKTIFRELLDKEASPALGCTEPMMFALDASANYGFLEGRTGIRKKTFVSWHL